MTTTAYNRIKHPHLNSLDDEDSCGSEFYWDSDELTCLKVKDFFGSEDICYFLLMLKQLLIVDPRKIIKPSEALKSHFINMENVCKDPNRSMSM